MSWTAVVLAGSRPGRDAFAEQFGTDFKALIPVAGEPMVRRPVRALMQSDRIGKILVLSQSPGRIGAVLPEDRRIELEQSQGTIAETILRLIADRALQWPLLVTTADHALLDSTTIDEFCDTAEGADVAIGVVERANLMRRLPMTTRTWISLRGGAYTGANLFALGSPNVAPAVEMWRSVEQDRKKGWRVVSILGPRVLFSAALRLVTLEGVMARLSARLGLTIKAIRLSNPLAGVDVDKAEDKLLAEAIIEGRG